MKEKTKLPRIGQNVPYFVVSVASLYCVCTVSGGFLSDCGHCLDGYDVDSIDKHQIWIILISCVIFSQWPFSGNFWLKIGMGGKKWIAISSGPSLIPKSVLTLYGATERESNWVWWIPCTLGIFSHPII